jgi:flagellin
MSLIINTNLAAMNAARNLAGTQDSLRVSLQRLSTGLRINSAKDDAAGLAVAESLNSHYRGSLVAIRNAQDGISVGQTAESALSEIGNNLQRVRELAVQSANGAIDDSNRSQLQKEVDQLTQEISRITQTANFNGTSLLSATSTITFQVGYSGSATNQVAVSIGTMTGLYGYNATLSNTGTINITTSGGASAALASIDAAITTVTQTRATFGAVQNRFEAVVSNLRSFAENVAASRSRIVDADYAVETSRLTRTQILQQAGVAMLAQANAQPQSVLALLQ